MRILLLLLALLNSALCLPWAKAPNCNPGYTGTNCVNPICDVPRILEPHDGTLGEGDMIEWEYSFTCNEEFQFYIDEYVTDIYAYGYNGGASFYGAIWKGDKVINPTSLSTAPGGWSVAYYKNIAHNGYGAYRFILQGAQQFCEVYITAPTVLSLDGGFIVNKTDDAVQEIIPEPHQGVGLNPQKGIDTYFAFKLSDNLRRPGRAVSVTTYLAEGYSQSANVYDRYGCTATQYAGPFHCDFTAGSYYHVKINGIDTKGNTWQRVYPFMCEVPGTLAPFTTGAPPSECHNGGVLVNGGTPQAECYCGQYYEGPMCDTIRCFNGGSPGYMGRCVCATGYSGSYCQDVVCYDESPEFYSLQYRAVIFVIRTGRSMVGHIQQILSAADHLRAFYARKDPQYVQQWILVTVTQGVVSMDNYQDANMFINAIKGIPNTEDTKCDDALYEGIITVLGTSLVDTYKRSPIFVFSDGLPNDNQETRFSLLHQLSFFRGQMFFMLADSATGSCKIETASEDFQGLRYLAQFSQGHVSYVKLEELGMTAYTLGTSIYKSVYVMTNDLVDSCKRAPKYQTFFIDKTIQFFFISATGGGLSITLTGPDTYDAQPAVFYSSSDNTYIWQVSQAKMGSYLLELTSATADPCAIRVYGNADTALWVGTSSSINEDVQLVQPTLNTLAHIVGFVNGVAMGDSLSIHPEAKIWTNEGPSDRRTVLYASNGQYRDNCAFNMYFGAWKCVNPFQFFYVNIYLTDSSSTVVQRTFTGFCSPTRTTATPPEGCLNGGMASGANGTCLCPAHYTGDKCEKIQCMNMGTAVGGKCTCINGFTGDFCQTISCYSKNKVVNFTPNGRSLTLVIQDSISTRTSIRKIKDQASTLIQDLSHQHKDWISNYQVWRFNDTSFTSLLRSGSTTDPNEFLGALTSLSSINSANSDPSCRELYVLPGLISLLENPGLTPKGLVYLFINGYMRVNTSTLYEVEAVYEMLELTGVQLNVVLMSGSPCGKDLTGIETSVLMNFVAFTGGQFIMVMPSKAGDVIRSVPTQYRGSFVYENYINDCTKPQSFYFPVDSQMQSFTTYVVGELADSSPQYFKPNGSMKYPYNVWMDLGMGSRLDQVIRECDPGWDYQSNRCFIVATDPTSWTDARDQCHKNGAVLLNIFNANDQAFGDYLANGVDYWTGLNDLTQLDKWVWDDLYGNPIGLDSTGYTHWAPGNPPKGDDVKRCAYDQKNIGWSAASCSEKHVFICVKHAYDADYEPDASNVGDVLERGIWKVNVQTQEGGCYVQVYAQSGIQMYSQFSTDIHMDDGIVQPLVNANDNRYIAHMTNQLATSTGTSGVLEYAHFYRSNLTIIEAETFQMRDTTKCAYEYLSTGFQCPAQSFLALTTGIDRFGYLYQRIQPVNCFKGANPGDCVHGTYYNGHCVCDPYYSGDLCTTPICQYGTLDAVKEHCTCFTGYTGPVCNIAICNRQSEPNELEPTPVNRTFVLLLDGAKTDNMGIINSELSTDLKTVFDKINNYPRWFTHFTGVVFRETGAASGDLSDIIESDDPTDFTTKIVAEYNKDYTPTSTKRSIMAAVNRAMESPYIQARSYIWIVTAGIPEDGDREGVALTAVAREHCYVNFLIIGDDAAPGGAAYNDTGLQACFDLVVQSGGQWYQVAAVAGELTKFWVGLFSNYYNVYYVSTRSMMDCSKGLTEYIQMGSNTSTIILDMVGAGQVNLFSPDGNPATLYNASQSRTNAVRVAQNAGTLAGLWKVVVPSYKQGFCSLAIRGQSMLDVYIAFTHDVGADGGMHSNDADGYPVVGDGENAVVAYSSFGRLNFAQIYSVDERTLLWSSPLVSRQKCVYTYISRNVFTCTTLALAVAIEGEDDNGYPFRRMVHVHCVGKLVKTTPIPMNRTTVTLTTAAPLSTLPAPACDANAKYDIMLIFDASEGLTPYVFQAMVLLMANLPQKITIGQDQTRFMLGSYSDITSLATRDFTAIQNSDDYATFLKVVSGYYYSGDVGNNIQSIFDTYDPTWGRQDANLTFIFFSSMGWDQSASGIPYTDPTNSAAQFRRQGAKIIPIGFGPNANKTQLTLLGLGCTKMAASLDEVDQIIAPWLASAICSSNQLCTW